MSSKKQSRTFFRRLIKPVVAIFSTLLALLAAEVVVRVFSLAPGIKPIQLSSYDCIYKRSTNPILGFELKANCQNHNPDFIQTYERTNAHGQRDKERNYHKPDGVKRVLLLGDSVVEGYGLRESETISQQLEALHPDGSTEVLNFGVSAYCTLAEIELLEVKGLRFDPDIVVLVFVENDFDNFNREAFPLEGTIDRPQVVEVLFQKSHFFRLTSIRLNLFHFGVEADPVRWNKDAIGDNNVNEGLRRFRELSDRYGFKPMVAIWPRFLNDRIVDVCFMPEDNRQLVIEHLAGMYNIPSIRLSDYFRKHQAEFHRDVNPRLHYSSGDELHPSPEGSRIAAEALKQILDDLNAGRTLSTREIHRSEQIDTVALNAARGLGQTQPNYARVHNRIGTELLKAGKPEEAAVEFKKAIDADPKYAGAYNNLGAAYERLGREEAQAQFEKALQLRPDFIHAHYNLARILMKKGQEPVALAQLRQMLRIDPNHVGALNMLGMALGRKQKFTEALVHLERAVHLDPNHSEVRNNLGAAYAGLGRLRDAVVQLEAALRLNPDDTDTRENLKRVKDAVSNQ